MAKKTKSESSISLFIQPPLPSITVCRLLSLRKGNETERPTLCASCVSVIPSPLFACIDESLWEFWLVYIHAPNGPGPQKARAPGTEKASKRDMHNIFTRCSWAVCFAGLEWWCPDIVFLLILFQFLLPSSFTTARYSDVLLKYSECKHALLWPCHAVWANANKFASGKRSRLNEVTQVLKLVLCEHASFHWMLNS